MDLVSESEFENPVAIATGFFHARLECATTWESLSAVDDVLE